MRIKKLRHKDTHFVLPCLGIQAESEMSLPSPPMFQGWPLLWGSSFFNSGIACGRACRPKVQGALTQVRGACGLTREQQVTMQFGQNSALFQHPLTRSGG
jgi:hypothetical protein